MKAIWNGAVLAESDQTIVVEGNHYFPPDSIDWQHFIDSDTSSVCPWKGAATYYTIHAGGEENRDAAWTYTHPKDAAASISGYLAFWRGVTVTVTE